MIFRPSRLVLFLVACAVYTLSAGEGAPSSPSRLTALQRAGPDRSAEKDPGRDSLGGLIAQVRGALFKLTGPPEIPAVLPSTTTKSEALPRSIGTTPRQAFASTKVSGANALAIRELALQPAGFTPYDRYLGPVRRVIASPSKRDRSAAAAYSFMREGHAFRYALRDPYRADLPAVTAARQEGDCKSKALWLYDRLGDPSALYVIGKLAKGSKASHAWVYWRNESRWWILDPTNLAAPIAADSVGRALYVPYYSFGKGGAFRHTATQLLLTQNDATAYAPAVASHPRKRRKRR